MAEPVTDGDDSGLHRQLSIVDGVTPISHSISNSDFSPINHFSSPTSTPHSWMINQLSRSDGLCVDTMMTPESKGITTKFTLPEDWLVEKRPRQSGNTIDKYYHDPETGRKFRSLKDVERYLRGGFISTRSNTKGLNYHEKPSSLISTSRFKLPDGWIVEEVPRKTGDYIDKYYYEPGTGHRFRSLLSVQRHLAELEENLPLSVVLEELRENNLPLSKAFKFANPIKNYGSYVSWKRSISKRGQDSSYRNAPPNKINWVIPSTAGETWNAFVGDELVPDSMKQLWEKRFMLVINNQQDLAGMNPRLAL